MGLPRYLNDKFIILKSDISSLTGSKGNAVTWGFYAGAFIGADYYNELVFKKKLPIKRLIASMIKGEFHSQYLKAHIVEVEDKLKKVRYEKYQGLKQERGCLRPETRTVIVPKFIIAKLKELDEQKKTKDIQDVKLRESVLKYQNKTYKTRLFPAKLKQVIFQRDNYCCCICGRSKDFLVTVGLHLEVDHIKEWEDGGDTSYRNGQTLCSECNKGKYHSKDIIKTKIKGLA